MPLTDRPVKVNIKEGHTSIDVFLKDVLRVMDNMKPYGMYVVLFDHDDTAHGYQFGLKDEDFDVVGMIANEHRQLED